MISSYKTRSGGERSRNEMRTEKQSMLRTVAVRTEEVVYVQKRGKMPFSDEKYGTGYYRNASLAIFHQDVVVIENAGYSSSGSAALATTRPLSAISTVLNRISLLVGHNNNKNSNELKKQLKRRNQLLSIMVL